MLTRFCLSFHAIALSRHPPPGTRYGDPSNDRSCPTALSHRPWNGMERRAYVLGPPCDTMKKERVMCTPRRMKKVRHDRHTYDNATSISGFSLLRNYEYDWS